MSNLFKISLKNGAVALSYELFSAFYLFLIRSIAIHYIGSDIVGISDSLSAAINFVNLAEFGLQTGVIYRLYVPLSEQDFDLINKYLAILKRYYLIISGLYLFVAAVGCFFVDKLLGDVSAGYPVKTMLIILGLTQALTVYTSYKRALLYADRKEYVYKLIDFVTLLFFGALGAGALIFYKSYVLLLSLRLINVLAAYMVVSKYCHHRYTSLIGVRVDFVLLKGMLNDAKHLFFGSVSGVVYGSWNILLITNLVGVNAVAYVINYNLVVGLIKNLVSSVFNSSNAIIGNIVIASDNSAIKMQALFKFTSHLWFMAAVLMIAPFFLLINNFVALWFGQQYLMSTLFVLLLSLDIYICLIQSPCGNFLIANGKFRLSQISDSVGATTNIIVSLLLGYYYGVEGVVGGIVISRLVQWLIKSYATICCTVDDSFLSWLYYLFNCIFRALVLLVSLFVVQQLNLSFGITNGWLAFVLNAIAYEVAASIILCVLFNNTKEQKLIYKYFKSAFLFGTK